MIVFVKNIALGRYFFRNGKRSCYLFDFDFAVFVCHIMPDGLSVNFYLEHCPCQAFLCAFLYLQDLHICCRCFGRIGNIAAFGCIRKLRPRIPVIGRQRGNIIILLFLIVCHAEQNGLVFQLALYQNTKLAFRAVLRNQYLKGQLTAGKLCFLFIADIRNLCPRRHVTVNHNSVAFDVYIGFQCICLRDVIAVLLINGNRCAFGIDRKPCGINRCVGPTLGNQSLHCLFHMIILAAVCLPVIQIAVIIMDDCPNRHFCDVICLISIFHTQFGRCFIRVSIGNHTPNVRIGVQLIYINIIVFRRKILYTALIRIGTKGWIFLSVLRLIYNHIGCKISRINNTLPSQKLPFAFFLYIQIYPV